MTETVTSAQNPKVKRLLALQEKSSLRREAGVFVLEGRREIERALSAGYEPDTLFVCPEIAGETSLEAPRVVEVPAWLYAKLAYRGTTEGVIAEMKMRQHTLGGLRLPENALVVVLESVEKPGNLGAVLRSADAAGADAVIVCDPLTDIYNPNLLRASTGALFSVPVACCTSAEAIDYLKSAGIRILTAQLQDSELYYDCDMRGATAIVIGTEASGLTPAWREAADAHIRIPMLGVCDSLNASVSAAILLFEALRQRRTKA